MLPIFLLLLFGSVTSIPIFSSSLFNIGCNQPIYQVLDPVQGLRPQLKHHVNFGYIHRLDTPTLRLGPDISVHPESKDSLPHQAASILSSIRYDEFNRQLELRGRISQLNAYRLQRAPTMEGTIMTLRFDTFGSNPLSSTTAGITGKVVQLTVIQPKNKGDHAELVMELTPEPNLAHTMETITYTIGGRTKKMDWTGTGKEGCRTYTQVNSRKDRFHETFESAMLL